MKRKMKKIFIPFAAASLALATACSDWTQPENKDFLPQIRPEDPAYLADLRAFKAGDHMVTMMMVQGSATVPDRQNLHPMAMPDSVDFLLMSGVDNLHPALVAEIAEVRLKKGTRTLNVIDYTSIRTAWEELKEAAADTDHAGDFTEEHFADYCKAETERLLACCERYGFDGVVASYLGGRDSRAAIPFIEAIEAWRAGHSDKLLFVRGYPAYIAENGETGKSLLSGCHYTIILGEEASASTALSRKVRDQLKAGVPTDRVVLEASVPSIADGGDDAQVGAPLRVAAQWVMDPKTNSTVQCTKRGLSASNAQEDYFNRPIYKRMREALAILNPAPENEPNPEN